MIFQNRQQAGELLSVKLISFRKRKDVVVLGIARGGVIVAKEIARFLHVSLRILVVKKIGAPYNSELAIGAVAPDTVYWDMDLVRRLKISKSDMKKLLTQTKKEEKKREKLFGHIQKKDIQGKTIILVDDGIATGTTVLAGLTYVRSFSAKRIILATPIIAEDIFVSLSGKFDRIIAVETVSDFQAVGQFYREFDQVTDTEIMKEVKQ